MAASNALHELIHGLEASLRALNEESVARELKVALHDPEKLPNRNVAGLAEKAINLLGELDLLLEPGHMVLADHFLGYTNTKCLVAAVELRIADALAKGPMSIHDLATLCSANLHRLSQILKPLYNNGIFSYNVLTSKYSNNHVSELLRSDHWTQWHNWVELYGNQFYDIARGIPQSIRDGEPRWGAQIVYDTDSNMFTYFKSQGWMPQLHRTLGGGATAMAPGILADYPWEQVDEMTVLDVGGGGGGLIASLLRKHQRMQGSVFDLKSVIDHVKPFFSEGGQYEDLRARVPAQNLIAGDFTKSVPSVEVYVMKWVLHDWKDEDALVVLRNIRRSIVEGEKSRLVLLESILSDGRSGRLSRYGDINMMMTANGQERTETQWRNLAQSAGWSTVTLFSIRNAWLNAIELRP